MTNDITCIDAAKALWQAYEACHDPAAFNTPIEVNTKSQSKFRNYLLKIFTKESTRERESLAALYAAQDEDRKIIFESLAAQGLTTPHQIDAWRVLHFTGMAMRGQIESSRELKSGVSLTNYIEQYAPIAFRDGLFALRDHRVGSRGLTPEMIAAENQFAIAATKYLHPELQSRLSQNLEFHLLESVIMKPTSPQEFTVKYKPNPVYG